jgi:cysteine desulfurase
MKQIYLDNAATTKMKKEVIEAMKVYLDNEYGNPNANYPFANNPKKAINESRKSIAELIGAKEEEVYFTSGGSEADNWAIKTIAENYREKGKHLITSTIEHHAVLKTMKWLENIGYEVTFIQPRSNGIVDVSDISNAIRKDTILISIMTANNEIGTIQMIKEIGALARKNKIIFHTDAVQAVGHIPLDVKKMKIDLLSASGHKFHGPKGVGFLYARNGVKISSFIHGGEQEFGLRAGTYNVSGIVGMGEAAKLSLGKKESVDKTLELRNHLIKRVLEEIPGTYLNGDMENRLPNNANILFENVDSESILAMLGSAGIYASAGSACTSGDPKPSHVLLSIGLNKAQAQSSIRLTLSDENTLDEIDFTVDELKKIIMMLRE